MQSAAAASLDAPLPLSLHPGCPPAGTCSSARRCRAARQRRRSACTQSCWPTCMPSRWGPLVPCGPPKNAVARRCWQPPPLLHSIWGLNSGRVHAAPAVRALPAHLPCVKAHGPCRPTSRPPPSPGAHGPAAGHERGVCARAGSLRREAGAVAGVDRAGARSDGTGAGGGTAARPD